ncbi:ergothioneine biosynthesis protein EgtC [Thioalkalivibrio sulfidiphilus]|uniref:ergothioneine biosynthesis protein EgtC n=1 Tax=Thioalkalivibrio sulfidiphilus TaxID=1033854 RepID=UPI000376C9F6|nr:ergothioneine biosynthesis protein EgtC [Thioalkalivibrio sulfidiphilus]
MCRHAAYLGAPIPLGQFLLAPAHSLEVQSWAPRELRYARLNADGFGFGWHGADGTARRYVNPMPIWSDVNLPALGDTLTSPVWLAAVRSATSGFASGPSNTQPFARDGLLFSHNGFLEDFVSRVRPDLQAWLTPDTEASIGGTTDSEYLFAVIRQLLAEDDLPVEAALGEAFNLVAEWLDEGVALLNVLVSDGERIYATRHAINHECPSLYYTTDDDSFPEGAQLVASERLTESDLWQAVPEHHVLILDPHAPPELLAL